MKNLIPPVAVALCCLAPWTATVAGDSSSRQTAPHKETVPANPDLPLPFGVSLLYFHQEQNYDVTRLSAFSGGFPVTGFGTGAITKVENRVHEVSAKFDWWALPWLNVHALVGSVSGQATAGLSPAVQSTLGGIQNFRVNYDGVVFGTGITLAAGYRNFFASVTADYSWGNVDLREPAVLSLNDPSGIETLVISPKVGIRNRLGALWVGAWYQHTDHTQSGSFRTATLPAAVQFQASVEDSSPWTCVVGGEWYLSKHWSLTAEGGFGNRQQVIIGTTFRF